MPKGYKGKGEKRKERKGEEWKVTKKKGEERKGGKGSERNGKE